MTPTMIAFIFGVFVGVLGGILIIGFLQMAREGVGGHPRTFPPTPPCKPPKFSDQGR